MRHAVLVISALLLVILLPAQQRDTILSTDTIKPIVLQEVTVRSKKSSLQFLPDKTVINVDAGITNAGATVLEVLEKSPGVTVDRNGGISLKGRQGVLVMMDGKPVQITGGDLNNLLAGMAASEIEQIELIDNPSSKYDAAGNAGIINIKTKKNRHAGFNGNINIAIGHGRYARTLNSVALNYNSKKINLFANLNGNINQNFTDLYALRNYYKADNTTLISMMEQPSYFRSRSPSQTIKVGMDYTIGKKTTAGFVIAESSYKYSSTGLNPAIWKDAFGNRDSTIITVAKNSNLLKNVALNFNGRHSFDPSRELSVDVDILGYRIRNNQFYENTLDEANGYTEEITGNIPAVINILTAKFDYTQVIKGGIKFETGWKSSWVKTDNKAHYFTTLEDVTFPDYGKTNHFVYEEKIHGAYLSVEKNTPGWLLQAGIRYENTVYDANQLGNLQRKDSAFSRNYRALFPTFSASHDVDSNHVLTLAIGRRIDRPPFQSLNPFVFVINKYTYETGNPFYLPQYTWNIEVSHTYKQKLVTSLAYNKTNDYFSQIFLQDSTGIIRYTVGNLEHMQNFGLSFSYQSPVTRWWSLSAMTALNYKMIAGFVWDARRTARLQANFNINNQFVFGEGWSGELSAFWQLHEQELQEITDPTGQAGVGVSKQVLKNRGVLKIAARDLFYTQAMKGFTAFKQSTEYFKLTRDSRSVSISFSYRFGAQGKVAGKRGGGGAEDEIKRAGGE